jgi:methyl-accepting chemotaxis protein
MKNMSIRTKILAGVVLVNLIGMITVSIYLHESYAGGLDVTAQKSVTQGVAAWEELSKFGAEAYGEPTEAKAAQSYIDSLKSITGADYSMLVEKSQLNEQTYAKQREAAGLPNNWSERENYVLIATTDEAVSEKMQLEAPADSIPEIGKLIGVENGACSKTCHGAVKSEGDFWGVSWSTDSASRAHTVFPVTDATGRPVGVVYSIEDISAQANAAKDSLIRTVLVIIGGLIIATMLIAWMLEVLVFRRLRRMIVTIEDLSIRVAGGDFDAHFDPDGSGDEIGHFEQFFARFMDLVSGTLKSLAR